MTLWIICRKAKSPISAMLLASLLILPAVWSMTPMTYGNNAQLPIAGPELARPRDSFDKHPDLSRLVSYLKQNRDGRTYITEIGKGVCQTAPKMRAIRPLLQHSIRNVVLVT